MAAVSRAMSISSLVGTTKTRAGTRREISASWPAGCPVALGVQLETQRVEPVQGPLADGGRVLADAAGEGQPVHAAQGPHVGGDVLLEPVAEDVHGQLARSLPASSASSSERMSLLRPGHPRRPLCLFRSALSSQAAQLLLAHDVQQDRGIEVAAAGAHDQALEGREAHRGVDGPAAADGRHRAAVAEVAGDEAQARRRRVAAQQRGQAARRRTGATCRGNRSAGCRAARRARRAGRRGRRGAPWSGGTRCRRPPPGGRPAAARAPRGSP